MTTVHAQRSPSGRHRWGACPAAPRLEAQYPEESAGPAAIDGTHTHTLLNVCITNGGDPFKMVGVKLEDHDGQFTVEQDRAQRVKVALDYVEHRVIELGGPWACTVAGEQRVDPVAITGRDDLHGTYDISILSGELFELIDYKDGMHAVPAQNNVQLRQYALGKISEYRARGEGVPFRLMRLTIIQPKLAFKGANPVSYEEIEVSTLTALELPLLVEQAAATDDPTAPAIPGESQCRYCRAKAGCTAYQQHTANAVGVLFQSAEQSISLVEQSAGLDPATLPVARLVQILEAAPLMRALLEAAETEALRRAKAGEPIPGHKLVNGRGSRKWSLDDEQIEAKLKGMGIPKEAYLVTKIVSPAQVEKLTWQNRKGVTKSLSKRQLATIDTEYVAKIAGALTLVPESDSRAAVSLNAAPLFGAVGEPAALPAFLTSPGLER